MKIYVQAALVTLAAGAVLVFGFFKWHEAAFPKVAENRLKTIEQMEKEGLPDFSFTTIQGETGKLSDFKDKVVILNFWASWCAPCVEEFPSMITLTEAMKGDVVLIAVSGDSSQAEAEQFLRQLKNWNQPSIKVVWDHDRSVTKLYDVDRLPESYITKKNLLLVRKIVGSINWHTPESVEYLKSIAAP